jgi:hypothetical protein
MLCGLAVVAEDIRQEARVVALWSDFLTFETKVKQLSNGNAILSTGGENSSETFDDLLVKLLALNKSSRTGGLGFLVIIISALGLILDIARERRLMKQIKSERSLTSSSKTDQNC